MAHMDECGSLFVPEPDDLEALRKAAFELDARMAGSDLLAYAPNAAVETMLDNCEPLARTYDVVVANPPYMGSSNMDKWLADWTKKTYPDSKRDLCTCFIERGFTLANPEGYSAMITMQSWMFLSNAEALRSKLLKAFSIETMAHLGARAFDSIGGEVVSTTATVFKRGTASDAGSYVRLVDYGNEAEKQEALKEAIANPGCGWFYRRDAESFSVIPGTPIAYWASDAMIRAFKIGNPLGDLTHTHLGMATCDNELFLREWWEVSNAHRVATDSYPYVFDQVHWVPYNKGGLFRRWSGNDEFVVNWKNEGDSLRSAGAVMISEDLRFKEMASWSRVSSGVLAVRLKRSGYLFDMTGPSAFGNHSSLLYVLGFLNSSVAKEIARIMSATIDFQPGQIATYPLIEIKEQHIIAEQASEENCALSQTDWDSFETSWDFQRHPMA